ncbi:MAG TPA: indole-3-glycerol phosphate synthase TrpC [Acidimicrobiales bacterium]|nr:indole-3-glycerol phosphate synthase TrpC [Acidimicrobiales bacterium]
MLDVIIAAHRRAAESDTRAIETLISEAESQPVARPFRDPLRTNKDLSVIAEIKRRSPSAGELAPGLVVTELAARYAAGGATALSVLTDAEFFGGSADDLKAARAACDLPVLRKDFTISEADVCDARLMGADAILLIVAALTDDELQRFRDLAVTLGLAALVEVHTSEELARALDAGADLIGVNSRNLRTFEVDLEVVERLARRIPDNVIKVAESGVKGPAEAKRMAECGYDAVLVGTGVVTASDPAAAIRGLVNWSELSPPRG